MSKADNILEAKAIAARALLRDRTGFLAPSANDEARGQATHDATVAIDAALRSGLLAGVPDERVSVDDQTLQSIRERAHPPDDPDLVGRALKDAKKDIRWLLDEVERLRASYGWLDERFPEVKAEVDRLRNGITRHRDNVEPAVRELGTGLQRPSDKALWALIGDNSA